MFFKRIMSVLEREPTANFSKPDRSRSTTIHPHYEQVLTHVNAVRAEFMLPPLTELPKGVPGTSRDCVIARGIKQGAHDIGTVAHGGSATRVEDQSGVTKARIIATTPREVEQFVQDFDNYKIPALIA